MKRGTAANHSLKRYQRGSMGSTKSTVATSSEKKERLPQVTSKRTKNQIKQRAPTTILTCRSGISASVFCEQQNEQGKVFFLK